MVSDSQQLVKDYSNNLKLQDQLNKVVHNKTREYVEAATTRVLREQAPGLLKNYLDVLDYFTNVVVNEDRNTVNVFLENIVNSEATSVQEPESKEPEQSKYMPVSDELIPYLKVTDKMAGRKPISDSGYNQRATKLFETYRIKITKIGNKNHVPRIKTMRAIEKEERTKSN